MGGITSIWLAAIFDATISRSRPLFSPPPARTGALVKLPPPPPESLSPRSAREAEGPDSSLPPQRSEFSEQRSQHLRQRRPNLRPRRKSSEPECGSPLKRHRPSWLGSGKLKLRSGNLRPGSGQAFQWSGGAKQRSKPPTQRICRKIAKPHQNPAFFGARAGPLRPAGGGGTSSGYPGGQPFEPLQ